MSTVKDQGSGRIGFFQETLKDWGNDDLLLDEEIRARIHLDIPSLLPILDWPELRDLFAERNRIAMAAKRRARRDGMAAIGLTTGGLILTAFAPPLAQATNVYSVWAGGIAALLILVGCGLAVYYLMHGGAKNVWLAERFYSERIRQFYFQFLLQNIALAVKAMREDSSLREYRKARQAKLHFFTSEQMKYPVIVFEAICKDDANEGAWVDTAWRHAPSIPELQPELDEILLALRRQRFDIQKTYTQLKLAYTASSPGFRSRVAGGLANVLTLLLPMTAFTIGILLASGSPWDGPWLIWLLAIQAAGAAFVGALRLFEDGMRWGEDARRYAWYLSRTENLAREFEIGDNKTRIDALRRMEELSYEELRRFLIAQKASRFVS